MDDLARAVLAHVDRRELIDLAGVATLPGTGGRARLMLDVKERKLSVEERVAFARFLTQTNG